MTTEVTAKSIRHLTIAIWAAALAIIATLFFQVISWILPPPFVGQLNSEPVRFHDAATDLPYPLISDARTLETDRPFHSLPIEEQIQQATLIAVAEYEEGDDGRTRAIIREILKKEPGTVSYFDVGDEHPMSSYYGAPDRSRGDGVVIFFLGSPATMRLSMSFEGERIRSLGDMPLALLREKCRE